MKEGMAATGAFLTIEAGLFRRRSVRNELEQLKFKGECLEWIEQKGIPITRFVIRGDEGLLVSIHSQISKRSGR